jgi:hypothetical protein
VIASQLNQFPELSLLDIGLMLKSMLEENPDIFGATVAFEPGVYRGLSHGAPYAFRDGDSVKTTFLFDGGDNYFMEDWYMIPAHMEELFWLSLYETSTCNNEVLVITYSVTFFYEKDAINGWQGLPR